MSRMSRPLRSSTPTVDAMSSCNALPVIMEISLLSFYALCPLSQEYYRQLQDRRLNPRIHVAKIMALSEVYGPDKVARALEDAFEFRAFSSDYIANILEQRERLPVRPGPLHLTRRSDLLDVELAPVDISI